MKNIFGLLFLSIMTCMMSCNNKVALTTPGELPPDSIIVTNGFDYFLYFTVDGNSFQMKNNVDHIGNGVLKQELGPCGVDMKFTSYFGYVSDTARKEWLGFGLKHCTNGGAIGLSDSTYRILNFPIEINRPDTAIGFIEYNDANNVLWSSAVSPNGLTAQLSHYLNITQIEVNYDGLSALKIKGSFSGWVYNANGDSLLISNAEFYSRARAN